MEVSTLEVVISAVAGLLSGSIASLAAPWANWGVEKKRMRRQRRQEVIKVWREQIMSDSFSLVDFLESSAYIELRPFIREEVRERVERGPHATVIQNKRGRRKIWQGREELLDEVARLERKWKML